MIGKAREFQKNIYFCLIDYTETFDCVDHNKLWKILKEMDIADHITCLLRKNLYVGQKATEFQKNIYICVIAYAKSFDCVDHNKLWKILKEMGIPGHRPASWEICMQVKKQQLELDMEQD